MFSQGYIGISDRVNRRFWEHKEKTQNAHFKHAINKYGWDNLVKKVVLLANKEYCLNIEKQLRPSEKIGWNCIAGGGLPPSFKGKKRSAEFVAKAKLRKDSDETRLKKSLAAMGNKRNLGKVLSDETKAKIKASKMKNKELRSNA